MKIEYVEGDATIPLPQHRPAVIAHIVNDLGGWGAGFSGALSRRYPTVETAYREWIATVREPLGSVLTMGANDGLSIMHMCAQHHWRPHEAFPIRYNALELCLIRLNRYALRHDKNVVMPRIGAGLAGARWPVVEELIERNVEAQVYVYDLPTA